LRWASRWDEPDGVVIGSGRGVSKSRLSGTRRINTEQFAVGDRVLHDMFGLGIVLDVQGEGVDRYADINFGQSGIKRLSVRFAPMEKLD